MWGSVSPLTPAPLPQGERGDRGGHGGARMLVRKLLPGLALLAGVIALLPLRAAELSPAERGKRSLLEHSFNPAVWSLQAYADAWKRWADTPVRPADYAAAFRDHYGLHAAPYPNHDLPMGLRQGPRLLGLGMSSDCLICHGGAIMGRSIVGPGNASLDIHSLFDYLTSPDGL